MSITFLPYKIQLREYQKSVWDAIFKENKKRAILIWHRRAGKDKTCLNILIAKSQERIGAYYYLFPQLNQARRNIWKAIDGDGKRFLDHFPKELIQGNPNNADMSIQFKNGSMFQLLGADEFNSKMGANPVGIILSEYSLQNPQAWDLLRPILAENGGWALFNYTPRGQNHGYHLYQSNLDNPKWFVQTCTSKDTQRLDGSPVINPEDIDEDRRSGMSEDLIDQEYYCSFLAAVPGAYFSKEIKLAEEQERIQDFAIDTRLGVNTYWDIGVNDRTSIWLVQAFRSSELRAIYYYENSGEGMNHYINVLHDLRSKYGFIYKEHYVPHDAAVVEWGTGKSRLMQLKEAGLSPVMVVPRIDKKLNAIEMARGIFSSVWFHKTNCQKGIACLRQYHKEYNEMTKTFANHPKHDWASNGADAFMQLAQSWRQHRKSEQIYTNRVNTGRII